MTRSVASRCPTLARGFDLYAPLFNAAYNQIVVNRRQENDAPKHRRHAAYAAETSGLLLIAFLLLLLTLIRYWHAIHWSLR